MSRLRPSSDGAYCLERFAASEGLALGRVFVEVEQRNVQSMSALAPKAAAAVADRRVRL